ncbi:spermatogenesis associated 6-like protein [Platysternon megacephalum]|uniref:Spermatogenesis associated 6-like protein n=1 Tax=Platysternon megacephalum TaxID=55544 RepID=A0A4D9EYP2_9SAUR|nr:spermatogenesis associated 6-like protein [Platysternon megacephalum]
MLEALQSQCVRGEGSGAGAGAGGGSRDELLRRRAAAVREAEGETRDAAGKAGRCSLHSFTDPHAQPCSRRRPPSGKGPAEGMAFPVDMLDNYSHEDLESSAEDYMSDLRCGDPENPEFLSLVSNIKIPISLSTIGFVPLYGGDQTHKVLALFAPEDSLTAVALYLADQWWAINDIVRTSIPSREGLQLVKTLGERVVLYVLNRIIYRKQEIERNEIPFLCHSSNDYAKILWKKGEAIGFYSVKPAGTICSSYLTQSYQLPVLDTMFVRKRHRGKDFGLMMLEDFVDSFTEDTLGLRYPLSSFIYTVLKVTTEVMNTTDSEILMEESVSMEKEGIEEEQQAAQRKKSSDESADTVASVPKEEPSDNGLSNSVVTEALEESVSENVSPNASSSLEEQSEDAGHDSQETPVVLGQSSLIVVELEDVSFQQHSEGQKNQSEEQSEESSEQMDQYTQTAAERAADSSSEETEIEVPIVDRRNLRRKAKGYKGPPKKKGKPA